MQLLQKLLNKINGLYYKQDYLCLAKESFQQSLHAYIISGNRVIKNITNHHLFTGYSPLIFTFHSLKEIDLSNTETLDIVFSHVEFQPNEFINLKKYQARIFFKRIHIQAADNDLLYYYEGENGMHYFISSFHRFIIQIQNRLFNKKPGNVYLPGNLLKQVQIAYSLPRIISLITVSSAGLYNLFPTDLHGQIDEGHYIISLRHGGKAAQQVEMARKILITEINSAFYKTAYSLGKNHMQELRSNAQLPFSYHFSETFQLPLPQNAVYCRELEFKECFDYGIHRIFIFKIINKRQFESNPATLAHIHNVYATWRHNNGLPGNYLFR